MLGPCVGIDAQVTLSLVVCCRMAGVRVLSVRSAKSQGTNRSPSALPVNPDSLAESSESISRVIYLYYTSRVGLRTTVHFEHFEHFEVYEWLVPPFLRLVIGSSLISHIKSGV